MEYRDMLLRGDIILERTGFWKVRNFTTSFLVGVKYKERHLKNESLVTMLKGAFLDNFLEEREEMRRAVANAMGETWDDR